MKPLPTWLKIIIEIVTAVLYLALYAICILIPIALSGGGLTADVAALSLFFCAFSALSISWLKSWSATVLSIVGGAFFEMPNILYIFLIPIEALQGSFHAEFAFYHFVCLFLVSYGIAALVRRIVGLFVKKQARA